MPHTASQSHSWAFWFWPLLVCSAASLGPATPEKRDMPRAHSRGWDHPTHIKRVVFQWLHQRKPENKERG